MRLPIAAALSCLILGGCRDMTDPGEPVRQEPARENEARRSNDHECVHISQLLRCEFDLKHAVERERTPQLGLAYVVAIGDRVVLTNRAPVHDGVRRFRKGDDCRLDPGGMMTVVGSRIGGDELGHWTEYHVRYARPPKTAETYVAPEHDALPYQCPDGAYFFHEDPLFIAEEPSALPPVNP